MALPRTFLAFRELFGLAEIVFGLARLFLALRDRLHTSKNRMFYLKMRKLECHNMNSTRKKVRSKLAKDNIDCPNGIISSTKNLGISKGHLYNIFRRMFESSCKTGVMNKTV